MLRVLVSVLSIVIGIVIIIALIQYNKKLKNYENVDQKYLYNINVVSFCIACGFLMLPFVLFYN